VAFGDGPFHDLKVPLAWTAVGAMLVAGMIAAVLLLGDRRETLRDDAYGAVRQGADAVVQPVGSAVSAPLQWGGSAIGYVRGYFFAVGDNRRLRAELNQMNALRDETVRLRDENARLRAVLGLRTQPSIPMATGRAVLDSRGPFSRSRLINVGLEQGVEVGHPVMSDRGLVGRVTGVANGASRVMLLSDVASRTPVLVDRTDARAILTGDGGPNPRLAYLRGKDPVREGDLVLTSGDGGVFPRGLPIGRAARGLDGQWRVRLFGEDAGIDFVRVLKFEDFASLVDERALEGGSMPAFTGTVTTPAETVRAISQPAQAPAAPAAAPAASRPRPAATRPKPAPRPSAAPQKRRGPIPYTQYLRQQRQRQ
jgi:rod shape-determining protein MreC